MENTDKKIKDKEIEKNKVELTDDEILFEELEDFEVALLQGCGDLSTDR